MKKIILLLITVCFLDLLAFAQQLPPNTCGIVNVYDAAGNRTKRVYFCNNGVDPYPNKTIKEPGVTEEFQVIDALYPNPTTGRFSVTFSKALNNALVFITDANGKIISRFNANGYKVDFDLSQFSAGVYFVRLEDAGNIIVKKVVKQ